MMLQMVALLSVVLLLQEASGFIVDTSCKKPISNALPTTGICIQRNPFGRHVKDTTTQRSMFGGLFGGSEEKSKTDDGSLAKYANLGSDDIKFDSMSDYISKWAQLFETDPKGMGLTTPVTVATSKQLASDQEEDEANIADVVDFSGVQLNFKNTATGYKSSKDEAQEKEDGPNKKKKQKLQGGVEVLVEKLSSGEVRVRARRCNIDEDTMIKEMSEEKILSELQKAVSVWKRENL